MRKRLAALKEDGVLHGFVAYPSASALGRRAVGAAWEATVPLDDLLGLEDSVWAVDSVDGRCGALAYTHEPERWLEAADALVGKPPIQSSIMPRAETPTLGPLEWRVALAMVDHPTGTLRALADATGLAPRTVRARRAKLIEARAIIIEPHLRTSRSGAIAYHVNVRAARAAWPHARAALGDAIVVADYGDSVYLFCYASDLATQARRVEAVRRLPEVERVDVVLNQDFRMATGRFRKWMEDELDRWRRARRPTTDA